MGRKPLLVTLMAALLLGALWLALPTTAHAQCNVPGDPGCVPPEKEKKNRPTATDRPATRTPTPTLTPSPTATATLPPAVAPVLPPPVPDHPYTSPLNLVLRNGGGTLLLLLGGGLLVVLFGGYIASLRFKRNSEGASTKPQPDLFVRDSSGAVYSKSATSPGPPTDPRASDMLGTKPGPPDSDVLGIQPGPPDSDVLGIQPGPPDSDVLGIKPGPPDSDVLGTQPGPPTST